ncbi:isoprenylcysteine carboxylmethyltransferase family protein [Ferrovibrio terrae]|uniref:methanethiol S-methyltransferase n=1 Tax=Ferrovibrio terrae TaxID=2594003 RepID=A0A516H0P3_9PROT|nr:methanethiol S-methyltransferase [Ferrovibrio terrae]QDO97349.1 isoprenylcysteine carboxylmethyltransferase family protein [Ferrovibrio terrae]
MGGFLALVYGLGCYLIFFVTFSYAIGFVGNILVPKSIDGPVQSSLTSASMAEALVINTLLLGAFAIQHSVMARPGFKRLWTRIVPKSVERSTYVLFASLILALLCWQWRPMPAPVWVVEHPVGVLVLQATFWLGFGLVLLSTFLIDHFELFGLRQVVGRLLKRELPGPVFHLPWVYRQVRHPLYLGFIIAFWSAPVMSQGHLFFAIACTAYIFIGIFFEERDLIDTFGDTYRNYRKQVGMLIPRLGGGATPEK